MLSARRRIFCLRPSLPATRSHHSTVAMEQRDYAVGVPRHVQRHPC